MAPTSVEQERLGNRMRPQQARILIVEDEALLALDMQVTLEGRGISVIGMVATPEQAIEAITSTRPDLVLLDLSLQGELVGADLARLIAQRWSIPIVLISGHLSNGAVVGLDQAGAVDFVAKPFHRVNLIETVEAAIRTLPCHALPSTP